MLSTLESLLEDQVRDLYSAEKQLVLALPKMAKAAASDELRQAIEGHLEETRGHVERLERVAEVIGAKPGGKKCKAMEGLIAEGKEVLEEDKCDAVTDVALIAAAQRVEHYEIAAYGTARAIAEQLGKQDVVDLLQQTLDEEGAADKKLTGICQDGLMREAAQGDSAEVEVKTKRRKAGSRGE